MECGAPTSSGKPCKKKCKAGERCYQHKTVKIMVETKSSLGKEIQSILEGYYASPMTEARVDILPEHLLNLLMVAFRIRPGYLREEWDEFSPIDPARYPLIHAEILAEVKEQTGGDSDIIYYIRCQVAGLSAKSIWVAFWVIPAVGR